ASPPPIMTHARAPFETASGRIGPSNGTSTATTGSAPARNPVPHWVQASYSRPTAAPQAEQGQVAAPRGASAALTTGASRAGSDIGSSSSTAERVAAPGALGAAEAACLGPD